MNTMDDCSHIHELIDIYLDGELSPDEQPSFDVHLKDCPQLTETIAKRAGLRTRIRAAAKDRVATPPGLEQKVRARLGNPARRYQRAWPLTMATAATIVLAFGLAIYWRAGGLRLTPASRESYIASCAEGISPVMQVGLKQHIHCAVFRKPGSAAPSREGMARDLGPRFAELIPAVQRHLPGGFRVTEAHLCHYQGRTYTHVTATDGRGLVSLLVTDRINGEALESKLRPVAANAGEALFTTSAQRFSVAGFETRNHLIYFVSDLNSGQNLTLFNQMVPEVSRAIRTLEI
jgi:hypothetical protein